MWKCFEAAFNVLTVCVCNFFGKIILEKKLLVKYLWNWHLNIFFHFFWYLKYKTNNFFLIISWSFASRNMTLLNLHNKNIHFLYFFSSEKINKLNINKKKYFYVLYDGICHTSTVVWDWWHSTLRVSFVKKQLRLF